MGERTVWLAFGANVAGPWGPPPASIARAIAELGRHGAVLVARSSFYTTAPLGPAGQPAYTNAVAEFVCPWAPAMLLRVAKRLERQAGRRIGRRWGARPLDIDILAFGGRRIGWRARAAGPSRRLQRNLVLPHPELARRGFVLVPLAEIAPHWRHPVYGWTASARLRRDPALRRGVGAPVPGPRDDGPAAER